VPLKEALGSNAIDIEKNSVSASTSDIVNQSDGVNVSVGVMLGDGTDSSSSVVGSVPASRWTASPPALAESQPPVPPFEHVITSPTRRLSIMSPSSPRQIEVGAYLLTSNSELILSIFEWFRFVISKNLNERESIRIFAFR
jgi:hypothetical protein